MGKYTSESIETLVFPDSVRKNASMYIGSVEEQGVFTIARELLDNGCDEHLAGRNKGVLLFAAADKSYWVQDQGSGVPQGTKVLEVMVNGKMVHNRIPTMQAVFGELHTSGKYRSEAYKVSIGSHGLGAKGTNATSEYFRVWTCFKGKWYTLEFKKGRLTKPVTACSPPKSPVTGKPLQLGTLIHFKPDATIFKVPTFPLYMASEWGEIMAYLNPGFRIVIAQGLRSGKTKSKTFFSEEGPSEYIRNRVAALKTTAEEDMFSYRSDLADVVIAFSNYDGCDIRGFTNGLHNAQGGHHIDSVSKALYTAILPFKGKRQTFTRRDFDEGLLGIVNAKLHKASFASQDKAKLTDVRMSDEFEAVVTEAAKKFFRTHKALALRLITKATKLNELKSKFKASKEVSSALSKVKKTGLPPNYAPPHKSVKVPDRELLIVEGDSAAGGLRKVRLPSQGLLPLTGKIANILKMKSAKALASKAIISIMAALGFEPKAADPLKKLNVGRIICLADADPDGCHINSLLLTLFYKIMPEAFDRGLIFVADMPEYIAQVKDQLITGSTQEEVKGKLAKAKLKAVVKHLKGWGEADPQVLKILAVDPSRKLIRIKALSSEDHVEFVKVMSTDVEARREALGISEETHHEE